MKMSPRKKDPEHIRHQINLGSDFSIEPQPDNPADLVEMYRLDIESEKQRAADTITRIKSLLDQFGELNSSSPENTINQSSGPNPMNNPGEATITEKDHRLREEFHRLERKTILEEISTLTQELARTTRRLQEYESKIAELNQS